jgi:predicted CDP-diglyceride synthetase/phosphatidate cytidylyltransferase
MILVVILVKKLEDLQQYVIGWSKVNGEKKIN